MGRLQPLKDVSRLTSKFDQLGLILYAPRALRLAPHTMVAIVSSPTVRASHDSPGESPLRDRLVRLERELDAIHRLTMATHGGMNPGSIERQALLTAIEVLEASAGTMYVHDAAKKELVFKHVIAPSEEVVRQLQGMRMPDHQGVAGAVFQAGKRRASFDVQNEAEHDSSIDERTRFVTKEMLTVPLVSTTGATIGVMQVLNKRSGQFTDDDWDILEILSAQAASVIETARLYEEARRTSVINLIGDISHDVKNLLTPVVTGTQTLEMMMQSMFEGLDEILASSSTPDDVRDSLQWATGGVREFYPEAMAMTYDGSRDIQERVREIADAIKGIVSEPLFEPTDLSERIESVTRVLRLVAERGGVAIDTSGAQFSKPIQLDRKLIYNALYNLINNAIPETPQGGMILVRTREVDLQGSPGVEIQVQDTGKGMPPHVRERMFTDNAVSTKPGGTGLGTRIVKNAVEAHGGTVSLDSEIGKGSTFSIVLPQRSPQETEQAR